mmetsp:Transcript_20835/g.24620  ORF Transcript_20835/g.24620 Transcript_20835/m.24620 type:complete len:166 (-) Transcript_20835:151-648(-)
MIKNLLNQFKIVRGKMTATTIISSDGSLSNSLETLIQRQSEYCPKILIELQEHKMKRTHWAWWVFPTEKPGISEPPPRTSVSKENAQELIRRAPPEWRQCLELITELAKKNDSGLHSVLPPIDLPRVGYFVKFWSSVPGSPDWLVVVLKDLKKTHLPVVTRTHFW